MTVEVKPSWLPSTKDGLRFVGRYVPTGINSAKKEMVLQQKWIGYRFGVGMEEEWRDVPLVMEVEDVRGEADDGSGTHVPTNN